jgi:rhomboid protease GluP
MKLKKTLLSKPFQSWSYSWASGVLLLFLIASSFLWRQNRAGDLLTASREQVFSRHEYYRLFTTIGMHADLKHFLGNSIFFFIFGFLLNSYFGLLWFPVLSILFGALVNAITLAFYPPEVTLLGASGVVYFMAGAWATLYFFIERKSHWMKRIMAAVGVSLILFFPETYEPQVSYLAHGIGFAVGIVVAIAYFSIRRTQIRREEYWEIDWMEMILNEDAKTHARFPSSVEHVNFFDTEGE